MSSNLRSVQLPWIEALVSCDLDEVLTPCACAEQFQITLLLCFLHLINSISNIVVIMGDYLQCSCAKNLPAFCPHTYKNNLLCCLYKLQLQRLMFPLGHLPPSTLFQLSLSLFCLNQFLALMHSQSLLAIFPAPS